MATDRPSACLHRSGRPDRCFRPNVQSVQRYAAPDAVEAQLRAQIHMAIAAGFDSTHLDQMCAGSAYG